jgi:hypothetical protein
MDGQATAVPDIAEHHVKLKATKSKRERGDIHQIDQAVSENIEPPQTEERVKFKKKALIWSSVRNCRVEPTKVVLLEIELVIFKSAVNE